MFGSEDICEPLIPAITDMHHQKNPLVLPAAALITIPSIITAAIASIIMRI